MVKKYYGIYEGIVIQNNDINHAGKVKVWVPGVSPTEYSGFRNTNKNIRIKLLGANIKSDLTSDMIESLKIILPWSPLGHSITSECNSGRYNLRSNAYNSGDGSYLLNNDKEKFIFANQNTSANEPNSEKIGAIYEDNNNILIDAFNGDNIYVNNLNPYTYNYKPSTYSNKSKGEFGIPNVGTHVVVQFFEGNPLFPFISHVLYGEDDYNGLYSNKDYPGSYENKSIIEGEYNHNIDKYRNKYVFNQKGGTFEINNTDNEEKVKLTHYSGSFKEFNNQTNIELATNNDQKLVQGNQFLTIRGNSNHFIGKDYDKIVLGDDYEKIGNLNFAAAEAWKSELSQLADYKQLFNIKRCNADNIIMDDTGTIVSKYNSIQQMKVGTPAPTPNNKLVTVLGKNSAEKGKNEVDIIKVTPYTISDDPAKKLDIPNPKPLSLSTEVDEINKSSMNGVWDSEPLKEKIKQIYQQKIASLIDIEKQMGLGGSKIIHITKDKVETIGMVMNDYGSIRIDSYGKMYNAEMKINSHAAFTYAKPSPLIEYVNVQSLPGGSYTLNVCDRFNVLVGAGGLNLKSYGTVNIGGTITNVSGEQVNISSKNEINIETSGRLNIAADIVSIKQKENKQVLVDSTLGIANNLVIGGSQYVEGELFVNHITAPCEWQVTEEQVGKAGVPDDGPIEIGNTDVQGGAEHSHIVYITKPNCIKVYPHSHMFPNVPLRLVMSSEEVRTSAESLTTSAFSACTSLPLEHKYKGDV